MNTAIPRYYLPDGVRTGAKPTCQMLTIDAQQREGVCGDTAAGRDGNGRPLCKFHGDIHLRVWGPHGGTFTTFTS